MNLQENVLYWATSQIGLCVCSSLMIQIFMGLYTPIATVAIQDSVSIKGIPASTTHMSPASCSPPTPPGMTGVQYASLLILITSRNNLSNIFMTSWETIKIL